MSCVIPRNALRVVSPAIVSAAILAVGAVVATPAASAHAEMQPASATTFNVSSAPAGVASGAELALDEADRSLYIADSNSRFMTSGGTNMTISDKPVEPKVSVFDLDKQQPSRSIDLSDQPFGMMMVGPFPVIPSEQTPDGIAFDSELDRIVVTNAHANGITSFDKNAERVTPENLLPVPETHPMGVTADESSGKTYVALNAAGKVLILDTASGAQIGEIGGLFRPSFMDIDPSTHRLYIGNADYEAKEKNFLTVVDTETGETVGSVDTPSNSRPQVNPVTGEVWANSFDTGEISVINPETLAVDKTIETNATPNKIAFDSQRGLAYTANLQDRTVTVIDARSGDIIDTLDVGAPVHSLVVDESTGAVYGTQHMGGDLTVITPA